MSYFMIHNYAFKQNHEERLYVMMRLHKCMMRDNVNLTFTYVLSVYAFSTYRRTVKTEWVYYYYPTAECVPTFRQLFPVLQTNFLIGNGAIFTCQLFRSSQTDNRLLLNDFSSKSRARNSRNFSTIDSIESFVDQTTNVSLYQHPMRIYNPCNNPRCTGVGGVACCAGGRQLWRVDSHIHEMAWGGYIRGNRVEARVLTRSTHAWFEWGRNLQFSSCSLSICDLIFAFIVMRLFLDILNFIFSRYWVRTREAGLNP